MFMFGLVQVAHVKSTTVVGRTPITLLAQRLHPRTDRRYLLQASLAGSMQQHRRDLQLSVSTELLQTQ